MIMNKVLATKDVVNKLDSLPTSEDLKQIKEQIKVLEKERREYYNKYADLDSQIREKESQYQKLFRDYVYQSCEISKEDLRIIRDEIPYTR